MAQLGQLQETAHEVFEPHDANVIVIFREEEEGQEGLKKVVAQTKTEFTLALDLGAEKTGRYSPGDQVHDSYIIDSKGVIRAILAATRYDRAEFDEFATALNSLTQ